MALTSAQRTTTRNAFITLYNSDPTAWSSGGTVTAGQWADQMLALLDDFRAGRKPRELYTTRVQVFITQRLSLNATMRTAIANHINGA